MVSRFKNKDIQESDLLENLDQHGAALNFYLFLLLRDKKENRVNFL